MTTSSSRGARPFSGNTAHTDRDHASIPLPQLEQNQLISLVTWTMTKNGWESELVRCRYQSRSTLTWNVTIDGEPATYSRDDWALCLS